MALLPDNPRKIVVTSIGALGDTLLGTPVLRALKETYPQCKIVYLVSSQARYIADGHPYVDEFALYDRTRPFLQTVSGFWQAVKKCWRADLAICLDARYRSGLITRLARVNCRIACGTGPLKCFTHRTEKDHMTDVYEVDTYFEALHMLHMYPRNIRLVTAPATTAEQARIAELLAAHHLQPGRFVVFSPFSTSRFKDWPVEHYRELAVRLRAIGIPSAVIGIGPDRQRADEIAPAVNFAGMTNIRETREIIAHAALLVSGGSFNLHLSDTTDTPSITLYGHFNGRPEAFIPRQNCTLICKPRTCSASCNTEDVCHDDILCMRSITVEEVFHTVQDKGHFEEN